VRIQRLAEIVLRRGTQARLQGDAGPVWMVRPPRALKIHLDLLRAGWVPHGGGICAPEEGPALVATVVLLGGASSDSTEPGRRGRSPLRRWSPAIPQHCVHHQLCPPEASAWERGDSAETGVQDKSEKVFADSTLMSRVVFVLGARERVPPDMQTDTQLITYRLVWCPWKNGEWRCTEAGGVGGTGDVAPT
jgi:hypothetical protein